MCTQDCGGERDVRSAWAWECGAVRLSQDDSRASLAKQRPFQGQELCIILLFTHTHTHTHTHTGWDSRCPFELKFWSLWGPIMYMISCPTLWRLRVDQANTARRSNWSFLKEINPAYSSEGLMLKLKLQYLGRLMRRTKTQTLVLGKTEGRRRRGGGRG